MAQPPPYSQPGYPPPQPGNPPAYPGDQKAGYPPQGAAPYPPQGGAYPPQGGAYPPPGGQPPPQPGYQTQPGYPPAPAAHAAHHTTTTTVIATQPRPVVVTGIAFGEIPVSMTCPRCQAQIVTSTIYQDGSFAWLVAAVLCFIGCWPCCLIPFCLDGCKDVTHHCPNCRSHLGTYRRM